MEEPIQKLIEVLHEIHQLDRDIAVTEREIEIVTHICANPSLTLLPVDRVEINTLIIKLHFVLIRAKWNRLVEIVRNTLTDRDTEETQ